MIKLQAIREVRYAGRTYMPGEVFPVQSEKDAKALKLIRKAKDAPPEVVPQHQPVVAPHIETKVLVAEDPPVELPPVAPPVLDEEVPAEVAEVAETEALAIDAEESHQGRGRRYRRRDMRSET